MRVASDRALRPLLGARWAQARRHPILQIGGGFKGGVQILK
jgi:hypothetical protein